MGIYETTYVFQGKIVTGKEKLDIEKELPTSNFKMLDSQGDGQYALYSRIIDLPRDLVVGEKLWVNPDSTDENLWNPSDKKISWSKMKTILAKYAAAEKLTWFGNKEYGPRPN